jgi:hypothetical protein
MGKPGAEEAEKPPAAAPAVEGQPPKPPEAKPAKPAAEAKPGKGETPGKAGDKGGEPAANAKPNFEELYKGLQKAHDGTLLKVKDLEGKVSIGATFIEEVRSLKREMNMRDGEAVMSRVENYVEAGNQKAADDLAGRELARRAAILGIDLNEDPHFAHLKIVAPSVALHQFLIQEPSLITSAAAAAAQPKTDPPPAPPAGSPPEEKIGGKSLAELKAAWAKEVGLFKGLPETGAGSTIEGFGTGSEQTLIREGLRQYHEG